MLPETKGSLFNGCEGGIHLVCSSMRGMGGTDIR
jgi:hypothetical protein